MRNILRTDTEGHLRAVSALYSARPTASGGLVRVRKGGATMEVFESGVVRRKQTYPTDPAR